MNPGSSYGFTLQLLDWLESQCKVSWEVPSRERERKVQTREIGTLHCGCRGVARSTEMMRMMGMMEMMEMMGKREWSWGMPLKSQS